MPATDARAAAAVRFAGLLGTQRHISVLMGRQIEAATGLTTQQAASLLAIREGAVRASEVAEQTHQHTSGVSRVLDSLVSEGLVTRETDPADRRAVVLEVTEAGAGKAREVVDCYGGLVAAIFARMEDEDVQRLVEVTDRFLTTALAALESPD